MSDMNVYIPIPSFRDGETELDPGNGRSERHRLSLSAFGTAAQAGPEPRTLTLSEAELRDNEGQVLQALKGLCERGRVIVVDWKWV